MLPARVRTASGWSDACILNISSNGLLVYSNTTAEPGQFVEIRRGRQLVIARIVWRKNQRIGLWSPEVHIQDLISDETIAAATQGRAVAIERRTVPRDDGRSRARARAIEFGSTLAIVAAISAWAAVYVYQILSKPLATVKAALGTQ